MICTNILLAAISIFSFLRLSAILQECNRWAFPLMQSLPSHCWMPTPTVVRQTKHLGWIYAMGLVKKVLNLLDLLDFVGLSNLPFYQWRGGKMSFKSLEKCNLEFLNINIYEYYSIVSYVHCTVHLYFVVTCAAVSSAFIDLPCRHEELCSGKSPRSALTGGLRGPANPTRIWWNNLQVFWVSMLLEDSPGSKNKLLEVSESFGPPPLSKDIFRGLGFPWAAAKLWSQRHHFINECFSRLS